MTHHQIRNGFTTPELLIVLTILSVMAALAVPGVLNARDVFSVLAARDVLVSAAARTRSLAMARGGAHLRVEESGVIAVVSRDRATVYAAWDLQAQYRVSLDIENSVRTTTFLEYDQLGVGRLANLTVRVRRGRATSAITFSAYGRPRAW